MNILPTANRWLSFTICMRQEAKFCSGTFEIPLEFLSVSIWTMVLAR